MANVIISVIMPCLNVVKYIEECLDSVVGQTYRELEIICVDAGSTDGTREVLQKYAGRDERISIIHSDVRSYGYQMNKGILAATGDYVGIVETDDILVKDAYEVLLDYMESHDADYVKGVADLFIDKNGYLWNADFVPCVDVLHSRVAVTVPEQNARLFESDNFLWNGLYKAGLMKRVLFNETPGAAFQDIGALFQIIRDAKKGVYADKVVYHYRQDNENASSYNRRGFVFLDTEYESVKASFPVMNNDWKYWYYHKLIKHVLNRFYFMSASGVWWSESKESIYKLREELMDAVNKGLIRKDDFPQNDIKELDMLFDNPEGLFEHEKKELEEDLMHCRQLVDRYKADGCIIFGCGSLGNCLRSIFSANDVPIHAFCDNAALHQGKTIEGIQVLMPDECVYRFPKADYVIANKDHFMEIREQLTGMGVEALRIEEFHSAFPGVLFMNAYIERYGG